ncbi:MAG TPA: 1-deoxy-D-xylulose-5-phosphate reductoisomerase [Rickettsiales bacterium]|nr:1-deoxy-D-xylulose-5-phosphate reductoisomerase [Rickettsiales bacterium]
MTRSVTILGSTGSIGESTVRLLRQHPEKFSVTAITAYDNVAKLAAQAKELGCKRAVIGNEERYAELKSALSGTGIEAAAGSEAVTEAARMDADIVIAAIVGAAGLLPALAAIERGATVALANKECLVCAGDIVMEAVQKHNATLLPVDSEHSAIFQILDAKQPETIDKIIVTASGGPFREYSFEQMKKVTVEEALRHPTWNMGAKITIDSATMMNKGLEIIEAWHLFPVKPSQIEVLVHPESIIHSMVSYIDGSVLAQLGTPDMITPIAYALAWPTRITSGAKPLDLAAMGRLSFFPPDPQRFPSLRLSRTAMETGGSAPAVLNAANEIAVARFLKKEVAFTDIIRIIEATLERMPAVHLHSIDDVMATDAQARAIAANI